MTLIMGYAGDDYAMLASDRMVTWSDGRETDDLTKAVFLDGRCLLGFSGDATIQGNTTQWIMEICSEALEAGAPPLDALILRAREYLRSRPKSYLGVLAVGYDTVGYDTTRDEGPGTIVSGLAVLSNGAGDKYGQWNREGVFDVTNPTLPVKAKEFRLWAIGKPPPKSDMTSMAWKISKYRKESPGDWRGIATRLAHQVVLKSREPNSGVGGTVQVAIFPRAAYGDGSVTYAANPLDLPISPTFTFGVQILADAPDHRPRTYGINIVQRGYVGSQPTLIFGARLTDSPFPPPFGPPPGSTGTIGARSSEVSQPAQEGSSHPSEAVDQKVHDTNG